jgi:hypothetical protein
MPAMAPFPSHPVAASLGWRPFAISAALAAASAACGFAAIAVCTHAGQPAQGVAATTYALFGAGSGAVCAAVQAAFDNRAARRWLHGGSAAVAEPPPPLPATEAGPLPAPAAPARAAEAAQPA